MRIMINITGKIEMNLKAAKLRNKSDFFKKHFKAANQSQLLQASSMQSIGTL